ncbi:hypothetical protein TVAG_326690 [Trichomonas vaginalis G3]|uniref:Uncharacterized protein n=1 Tax=Trichomonas vaginalis (strain ATCC PRA-98 / G3) TaxID=412133 RepID=A2G4U9_TRIV3|nr:hypothetical protein TVAG_326690 [Trichomonas vaginalis G3]|eukprot:XP_001300746.1 hypothetical protein [Trichomonas vaginalis G3]
MTLAQFDCLFNDLRCYISALQSEYESSKDYTINLKIGKIAAKVFEIKKQYVADKKNDMTHDQKHIITHYCPRHSRENEQKRKKEFVKDTDYKQTKAYEIIKSMNGGKAPRDDFLKGLIQLIKETDDISVEREATRSKAGRYIFLEKHINVLEELHANGSRFESD